MISPFKWNNLAFTFLLFFISSCNNKKEEKAINSNITKVTVAISGMCCEGGCPYEAVRVSNDLTLEYFGGVFAKRKGYLKGKISKETWDSVQTNFNKFLIFGIDSIKNSKTDHPETEFIIYEGQNENNFRLNTGKLSDRDSKTLFWLTRKVVEKINLKPTDSIDFGTALEMGPPPPLPLKRD